jgi:hypothetical protein
VCGCCDKELLERFSGFSDCNVLANKEALDKHQNGFIHLFARLKSKAMMLFLVIIFHCLLTFADCSCKENGTRFGLPWDKDLIALSIQRYIDAHPEHRPFNGCKRAELHLVT